MEIKEKEKIIGREIERSEKDNNSIKDYIVSIPKLFDEILCEKSHESIQVIVSPFHILSLIYAKNLDNGIEFLVKTYVDWDLWLNQLSSSVLGLKFYR